VLKKKSNTKKESSIVIVIYLLVRHPEELKTAYLRFGIGRVRKERKLSRELVGEEKKI